MSRFTPRKRKGGFTLIEIMIVVLIIAILLAVAIPNFMKARETSRAKACQSNLRQIETAKEQWAMDTKADAADVPVLADLVGGNAYIKSEPKCPSDPSNAEYNFNAVNTAPTCPVNPAPAGHVLQ